MAVSDIIRRVWQAIRRGARAVGRGARTLYEVVTHLLGRLTRHLGSDSAKRRGQAVRSRSGSLISVGLVLLLLGAIGFSVYQVARHVTVDLNTLRTQEILDESYVHLDLYLFRDEAVMVAEGSDVCHYTVRDGEKVGVGTSLGTAHAVGDPALAADLQARLDAYGERIALLEELGGLGTPADARAEAEAVDRHYLGLLEAAGRGDLAAVSGFADRMQTGIGRYDILTGAAGSGTVTSLRDEQAALVAGYPAVGNLRTERGGYFYYEADGYESNFPYASALTMTPAEFCAMVARPAAALPTGVVGKMVYNSTWYAAAYVPESDPAVELFQRGLASHASYDMTCGDSAGTVISMSLERMVPDGGGVLLVFSSRQMPEGFDFARTLRVETVALSVSGYRIPEEALVTLYSRDAEREVTGVYILSGGVVEFRKVRLRVERDGYIIAETYEEVQALLETYTEEQRAEDAADGWRYLGLNDNIITSGNELYEGKMIS